MKVASPRVGAAVLAALWVLGCSSEDEAPACRTAQVCDVGVAACQQLIFDATACERKQEGATAPAVRVITVAQFVEEMNAAIAAAPVDPNEAAWNTALEMIGLLPAGTGLTEAYTEVSAANVVAYYDPETERVSIIDSGGASDPLEDIFALAHEFVHALQDQDLSIDAYRSERATSLDAFAAVTALIEGEATVVGLAAAGRSQGGTPQTLRWSSAVEGMWTGILESIDAAPIPFVAALQSLPYPVGTQYVYPSWLAGGQGYVDGVYAEPPLSLLDLQGRVGPGEASTVQALDCYATTPPAGYSAMAGDSLGMTGALALWMSTGQAAQPAWISSARWRGDSLVVFRSTTGPEIAVAWRTRWDTAATASQVANALQMSATPGLSRSVAAEGTEVTLLVTEDATLLSNWTAAMQCGSTTDLASLPTLITTATVRDLINRRAPLLRSN